MRLLLLASLLAFPALLAGCSSTIVATAEPACRALKTVRISKDDALTEGTASQIEANNLARKRLCKA